MRREEGFTIIELMVVVGITSALLTLGVFALRVYWLGQSLHGERDQVFSNLRALQQQVVSESNPIIFGAWFDAETPATYDGSPQWGTVRLSSATAPITCRSTTTHHLDGGVQVDSARFADSLAGVPAVGDLIAACRSQVSASADAADFVFFLARGTATSGCVTLTQPNREMEDVTVAVSTLTGRVERIDQDEVDSRC